MSVILARTIMMCALSESPSGPAEHIEDLLYRVATTTAPALSGHTVIDATTGQRHHLQDIEHATHLAQELERSGRHVHLGPMGLGARIRGSYRLTLAQSLDPCTSIGVASLELERLVSKRTSRSSKSLHIALSTYWSPTNPDDLQAIDWGARVLATPKTDVSRMAQANHVNAHDTPRRRVFFGRGLPAPSKWTRRRQP